MWSLGPEWRIAVRAMKVVRGEPPPQDLATDTLHRWTERRRELLLADLGERLIVALTRDREAVERLTLALERRAS